MNTIIEALKEHLRKNKDKYVKVDEWAGSTETGFYDEVTFDIDDLMREIDEFAAGFAKKKE